VVHPASPTGAGSGEARMPAAAATPGEVLHQSIHHLEGQCILLVQQDPAATRGASG